ncbi:MAG: hypothetical protein KGK08_00940 [Acidobacteriota bacterium]|nr:hypothetical protein [Acidobacteriota bacterium]
MQAGCSSCGSLHHNGGFPYFEVLLKTSRLSGTALNSQLVACRAYADLP